MKKLFIALCAATAVALGLLVGASLTTNASPNIGHDKYDHVSACYGAELTLAECKPFAATLTTIAIGAAKEQFVDDHFDRGDFAADCAGALFYQVHF